MATIHSESVSYAANGTELNGYLAYDQDRQGPRPGVILIHEWWGLTDYIKQRSVLLAGLGYCGFAIDMYGGVNYRVGHGAQVPLQVDEPHQRIMVQVSLINHDALGVHRPTLDERS